MIWFLESHSFLVAVSASFLFGILLDMLLKKLTGSEKIGYVAVTAAVVTAVFIGAYGTTLHALACILMGQVLLFAAEYDYATHTVPDYVPVLILMVGLLEVEFAPALLGLVLVPLPFVVAALVNDGSYGPLDVLRACPPLTVVVPLVLFGISIYTTLGATSAGERVFCLAVSALYILACYISVGCIAAVRDMED